MKSFLVVCVLLVIGSADCGRIRRLALFSGGPPKAVPAPPGADVAAPSPLAAKNTGMNIALGNMVGELDKESALGGPVNTAGLMAAVLYSKKIEKLGGEVDKPNKEKLDDLTADFVLDSTNINAFLKSAAPPKDTAVAVPAPAAARR